LAQRLIFSNAELSDGSKKHYTIESLELTQRNVDDLTQLLKEFVDDDEDKDMNKIVTLPDEPIRNGIINVIDDETQELKKYMFILYDFKFHLMHVQIDGKSSQPGENSTEEANNKEYTYMLILPKGVIDNKVNNVKEGVRKTIMYQFVVPLGLFSLSMVLIISYCLKKISFNIT